VATLPLAGTWGEFYDIYREVLVKHDKHESLTRLDEHLARYPQAEDLERWAAQAGLEDVRVDIEEFSLLFRSSREFFFAPVIEFGPLPVWKALAGKGQELQDVFWYIKQSIDAYFGDRAFSITVKAGCLRGRKRFDANIQAEERDMEQDWISVQTGEVDIVSEGPLAGDSEEADDADGAGELEAFRDPADVVDDEEPPTRS
jgi:hypothetical protein